MIFDEEAKKKYSSGSLLKKEVVVVEQLELKALMLIQQKELIKELVLRQNNMWLNHMEDQKLKKLFSKVQLKY